MHAMLFFFFFFLPFLEREITFVTLCKNVALLTFSILSTFEGKNLLLQKPVLLL